MAEESPIFTRCFDFLDWLLAATNRFPRSQRFVVTGRLLDAALDFQERLIEANSSSVRQRGGKLAQADAELDKVRLYLRMAAKKEWLSEGQYEHAAKLVAELGRLRGGSYNNNAERLRCGARNRNNPDNRNRNNGFRVVVAHGFRFSPEMTGSLWAAQSEVRKPARRVPGRAPLLVTGPGI